MGGPLTMMNEIAFQIPGLARGKGRPRMTRTGHVYTDAKTMSFEGMVRSLAAQAMADAHLAMAAGVPVAVRICISVPCPASYSRKRRAAALDGNAAPYKPDVDNVAKSILDAMNGIVYDDDSRVVSLAVSKRYADGMAGTEVQVSWKCP